jgi:hypothetical protein
MVQADTHMPQPMHSMAPSMRRRSRLSPPTCANTSGPSSGTKAAATATIFSLKGVMSTTRSRISGK